MIHSTFAGGVLFVTLNDPARRNALGESMLRGLASEIERTETDESVRAFVLRGAGGVFCAGGDFATFKTLIATPAADGEPDPIARTNRAFGALLTRLADLPVPTLAAVNGAAAGGGTGLAAACDCVLAHSSATFATPEVSLGFPPAQIAPFIAARIGRPRAARFLCEAQRISAGEALAIGLVDRIADDLDAALLEHLQRLGRAEPAALRATKRILEHRGPRDVQLDVAATEFASGLRKSAEEGIGAFAAKRAPAWLQALDVLPEMPR